MELVKLSEYNRIFAPDCFFDEFKSLIKFKPPKNGKKNRYMDWFTDSLERLDTYKKEEMKKPRFEPLEVKDGFPLYSIRYANSPLNPRIIYIFFADNDKIVLMNCFCEKHDGDYDKAKKIAVQRAKNLGLNNELKEAAYYGK